MSIEIRKATLDDVESIALLSEELGYPCAVSEVGQRLREIIPRVDHEVFVAEGVDGSVIGWIHIFAGVRLGSEPFAEVGGLIVSEPCRGQGVGKSLFQKAEVWAGEKNLGFLRIRSRSFRSEAHRFYELLGCTPIKTQKVFSKELQSR